MLMVRQGMVMKGGVCFWMGVGVGREESGFVNFAQQTCHI